MAPVFYDVRCGPGEVVDRLQLLDGGYGVRHDLGLRDVGRTAIPGVEYTGNPGP